MAQQLMIAINTSFANQLGHTGLPLISNATNTNYAGIKNFLQTQENTTPINGTVAYLNWMMLSGVNLQLVRECSGFEQVPPIDLGDQKILMQANEGDYMDITQSGYIYIFVSNNGNKPVKFDDLFVYKVKSALLEETHYYPFGLSMSGISSKAAGSLKNKRKYNAGSELHNEEFSDGSGLEIYSTPLRSLDPQLGRWWQIDPKPDFSQSLYCSMDNNPILKNDPLGDVAVFYNDKGEEIYRKKDGHKYITATIIGNDRLTHFNKTIALYKPSVNGLQKMGITYDTKSLSKFFDFNGHKFNANTVDGHMITSKMQINGKLVKDGKLYAEAVGNLVLKDGVVTTGKNQVKSDNEFTASTPGAVGNEPNKVGSIHTHPTDKTIQIYNDYGHGGSAEGGKPSPEDHTYYRQNDKGVRHVAVDSKNIYIYNGNSSQTITIPKL